MNKAVLKSIFFTLLTPTFVDGMEQNMLQQLPAVLFYTIIMQHKEKPWDSYFATRTLRRVSHYFCQQLSDNNISKHLAIGPMHYAALTNNANKIICLRLQGNCTRKIDTYGFKPHDYARAGNCQQALDILDIGNIATEKSILDKSFLLRNPGNIPPLLSTYTEKDIWKAAQTKDYGLLVKILKSDRTLLPLKIQPITNKTMQLLLKYATQSFLEEIVYKAIVLKKDLSQEIINLFNQYKANPNIYLHDGKEPLLHSCIRAGMNSIFKFLITHPEINLSLTNNDGMTPLDISIQKTQFYMFKKLLECTNPEKTTTLSNEYSLGLCTAIECNNMAYFKLLLEYNANHEVKDSLGKTALHYAALNKSASAPEYIRILCLDKNVFLERRDNDGATALHQAVRRNYKTNVETLLTCGANPETLFRYNTIMHIAALHKCHNVLDLLIEKYPHLINRANDVLITPLHISVINNDITAANKLIHSSATIDCTNIKGQTPLHYAASSGFKNIALSLLCHGAQINKQCTEENIINNVNHKGYTALHYTAMNGHVEVAQLLIQKGADTTIKAADGSTAYDVAVKHERDKWIKLIC